MAGSTVSVSPLCRDSNACYIWMSVDPYPGRLLKRTYVYNAYTDIRRVTALILRIATRFKIHHARVHANRGHLSLSLSAIISNIYIIQSCVAASIRSNKQCRSINKLFNVREKLLCRNCVMTRICIDGTTF